MDATSDGSSITFQLMLLLIFTLMNAFFAGAEMAVVSVNRNRIRMLAEEGNRKAKVIQSLFDDSTKFLSTIQVAITFAGFYSSASAASGISPVLAGWMAGFNIPYSSAIAHNGVTLVLMFFNLVFGELVPKRIALQKSEFFCMMTVMPIHYISIVLSPFIKLLSVSTKAVLRLLKLRTDDADEAVTEDEIRAMMKIGLENGTFDNNEKEMIDSVFEFDRKPARELMVPRQKVFAIDIDEPIEEMLDEILETRHSRIPVYEEDIDKIIGILQVKDVMIRLRKGTIGQDEIRSMLKKPYFVPEKKDAAELFRQMQQHRMQMAVLLDEYGGFSGIVTIEDLVEEIMGDINEEYENVEPEIQQVKENEYIIDASVSIDDINEMFGLKLESEYYDTISGYIIEQLGYIPNEQKGGTVNVEGCVFTILEVKGNTIQKIHMKRENVKE